MSGSDFSPEPFTLEEKKAFTTILIQLRSFERSLAQSFREVKGRLDQIEDSIKKNKDSLTATKGSVTKLRNNLTELHTNFEEKIKKVAKLGIKYNDKELENFDELEDSSINESNETIIANEEENGQEIMIMDPFLGNGAFVGTFDGNPTLSFTKWVEKFKDKIS